MLVSILRLLKEHNARLDPVLAGAISTAALLATGVITIKCSHTHEPGNASGEKPNIIVILADDLGYGDLGGYFGGEAATFDLLPTFLDILGVEAPPEDSPNVIDGVSLLPLLTKGEPLESRPIVWARHENRAVRRNQWKMVSAIGQEPELYNMAYDIGEQENVAKENPQIVRELMGELEAFERSISN